jgi:hypothetical protein
MTTYVLWLQPQYSERLAILWLQQFKILDPIQSSGGMDHVRLQRA